MKQLTAVFLAILLSCQLWAQSDPPGNARDQLNSIAPGTKVRVKMKGGEVVRGRLGQVNQDSFTVSTERGKTKSRAIPFNDVDTVAAEPHRKTPVAAWIVAGAVVAVVVIVVAAVAIERHNE